MNLFKVISHPDGSATIETVMRTKSIRTLCANCAGSGKIAGKKKSWIKCRKCAGSGRGPMATMTTLDGERWVMDARREQVRVERADRLHPGWLKKFQKPLVKDAGGRENVPRGTTVRISGGVAGVKELPVLQVPGAWKRKNPPAEVKRASPKHGISRRRKTKTERDVKLMPRELTHSHRCEGHRFTCGCLQPFFRRLCGGHKCLRTV